MRLREVRNERNIGLNELSRISGLSAGYISDLERGHKKNPSKTTMECISKALKKSVSEIFFCDGLGVNNHDHGRKAGSD